jgi:hypothetical protein
MKREHVRKKPYLRGKGIIARPFKYSKYLLPASSITEVK